MTNSCILYAEDDENDVFIVEHAFKQAHIEAQLHVVPDGQEAIDYLRGVGVFSDRSQHPLPNLLLLDLKMPHKNGMEVLAWIRQQPELRKLPVIIYTSSHHETDLNRAYELGANSFIIKRSELSQTIDFARSLKSWWLDHNEFAPL